MEQFIEEIEKLDIGTIRLNEPLSNHTTMKVGGPVQVFVEPTSLTHLVDFVKWLSNRNIPFYVIGRGSNLIVSDSLLQGVVIHLDEGFNQFEINGSTIRADAGCSLIHVATTASRNGLSGFEFAGGIPGSIGGAVFMNAGAHQSDISKILLHSRVLFPDGTIETLTNEEMDFSYRTSLLQQKRPGIVLDATFQLIPGNASEITEKIQANKEYRKRTQPWDSPCAGSIFRNPYPEFAGALIERAGLKGYSIGDAQISTLHANFIVNRGSATAKEILELIQFIQRRISDLYQIELEPEVEIVRKLKVY